MIHSPMPNRRGSQAGRSPDLVNRPPQQAPAVEPVVPVAEAFDAVAPRELGLGGPCFGQPQVVIAQVSGQARLMMAAKERPGLGDVRPFRESFPPPLIVLRNRVELRQMKRNQPNHGSLYRTR